jgi:hypothetical protein
MRGPRHIVVVSICVVAFAAECTAQSLYIAQGERAVEGSVGWSVGPFSNGVETHAAASVNGRWDVAFGVNWYTADFGGPDDTTFIEWSQSVRYFFYKESDDGVPISVAGQAAFFQDHYDGGDKAWYALLGGQLFKRFRLSDEFALYPYVGFSLAGESYSFGGDDAEYSVYLTRQLGVHATIAVGTSAWLRVTAEEHAFRRETYRGARVAYVRRF